MTTPKQLWVLAGGNGAGNRIVSEHNCLTDHAIFVSIPFRKGFGAVAQ
jgi:hypothetical protein